MSMLSEATPQPSTRLRVLVIEDEGTICDLLSEIIGDDGFEPVCVNTDKRAYEALQREASFACMMLDVNLGAGTTG